MTFEGAHHTARTSHLFWSSTGLCSHDFERYMQLPSGFTFASDRQLEDSKAVGQRKRSVED
eukprot:scaffold1395_cov152-Amphora_coffeaeformis.AAC.12